MKRRHITWLASLFTLAAVTVIIISALFMEYYELRPIEEVPHNADFIVVLGGGGSHRPYKAAELYNRGYAPKVIVSGWGDNANAIEWLMEKGVPGRDIIPEPYSHSTIENAVKSSRIIKRAAQKNGILLVTSNFHSVRAKACFKQAMPGTRITSVPAIHYSNSELRSKPLEKLKLLCYWLFYGARPF